jgi:hypothetical protein
LVVAKANDSKFGVVSKHDFSCQFYAVGDCEITTICEGSGSAILAMKDTMVHRFNGHFRYIFVYLYSITCVNFNPIFDVVAVGDKSGNVVLCYFSNGEVFQSLKLKRKRIVKVHITQSWGIIAIEARGKYEHSSWVCCYTQRGECLGEFQIGRELAGMTLFRSGSGFDYLVMADLNGVIHVADPFKLAGAQPVWRSNRGAVGIAVESGTIICVDLSGRITYIEREWE